MASKGHLKAKFRVGSINGPINYTYGEKAFHAAAVPPAEKTRTKGNGWNGSTDRGEVLCLRRQRQLSAYDAPVYQYNFRAEVLPQPTPVYVPKPSHLEFDRRTFLERQSKGLITADGHRVARRPPARCMEMPVHPSIDPDARVAQHQLWDQGRRTAQQRAQERVAKTRLESAQRRDPAVAAGIRDCVDSFDYDTHAASLKVRCGSDPVR